MTRRTRCAILLTVFVGGLVAFAVVALSATLPPSVITAQQNAVAALKAAGIPGTVTISAPGYATVSAVATTQPAIPAAIDYTGHVGLSAGGTSAAKIALLANPATIWNPASTNCTLANVVLSSTDGKGYGGAVQGTGHTISGVDFGALADGLHYENCVKLTIVGGTQTGADSGRCHYLLGVKGLTWTGGIYGPSSIQSPVRFSAPGVFGDVVNGNTITGVCSTQVGSPNPIATWAIHACAGMNFVNCFAVGGEFSFDGAGEGGAADVVAGNTITNLTTIDTKIHLDTVATKNTFKGGTFVNLTGECVSGDCLPGSGNVIDGATLFTQKHGVHFYLASDLVIKNSTLYTDQKNIPMIDGLSVATNDGGGNKVVVVTTAQLNAMVAAVRAKVPKK